MGKLSKEDTSLAFFLLQFLVAFQPTNTVYRYTVSVINKYWLIIVAMQM